jgi:hypothetical protein
VTSTARRYPARHYHQDEIDNFVKSAAEMGSLTLAAHWLTPSKSSLKRWLVSRGYRIERGQILKPSDEPATPRGAA